MKRITFIIFLVSFLVIGIKPATAQAGIYSKDRIQYLKGAFYEFIEERFTYCTDAYNDIYGQFCISGNYIVAGDSIYFTVLKIETRELGSLHRIDPNRRETELVILNDTSYHRRDKPSSSNFWAMSTGKVQSVNLENTKFSAKFRIVKENEYEEYIEIDGERFYLNDYGLKD
jgi:hypothetical protein